MRWYGLQKDNGENGDGGCDPEPVRPPVQSHRTISDDVMSPRDCCSWTVCVVVLLLLGGRKILGHFAFLWCKDSVDCRSRAGYLSSSVDGLRAAKVKVEQVHGEYNVEFITRQIGSKTRHFTF